MLKANILLVSRPQSSNSRKKRAPTNIPAPALYFSNSPTFQMVAQLLPSVFV